MADSFQDRIGVFYSGLSKGHKRIADFIKNNYEKASFMTAAKLGKTVGVSESTVVRFASHVGFDGYPELQKHLQELVKSHLTSVQRMEVAANRMGGDDIINDAFAADAEMLKRTREGVSREDFFGSVAAINKAHKIYVLGSRSSASLASFASFYLNYLCDNVVLIDTSSTSEMFEQMFRISEQDVCIAISFPRYSNQTINALSFAKSRGATIISITDGEMSPIAQYATYLLVAESSMVSFVDSLVAPLSLINALIAACAKENDGHVCENLGELEKIWDKYHVYRTDKEEQE
ncbi:MAG: MurR/RpiR family transcriptional regulator [Clostridium sp.]|nr:MurR/RpiR family transcriptional regulator [Clostridium sp.]MDY5895046.1 MurR/RpiR family transcriptional regulator [Oscillospiraceae bacterium]